MTARRVMEAFGEKPSVARFYDEDESYWVDVAQAADRPMPGLTSYSTLSLSRSVNRLEGRNVPVELAGVASTSAHSFANVITTAAFYVMKDGWLCAPGVVFPGLVTMYDLSPTMEHVMWWDPFPWPDLASVTVGEHEVHWLVAIPISESERRFLIQFGAAVFEERLAASETPYFDLARAPVV